MTRRRWLYTSGGRPLEEPIEVTEEWKDPAIGPALRSEAEVYGTLTPSTDGVDISTKRRHHEYMRRNNLTVAEDFKGTWEKAAKEREAFLKGESQAVRRDAREDVGRALYEARRKRK
jgi:hypothetical protein